MKKFHIKITDHKITTYEVFAESKEEAIDKYDNSRDYREIDSKNIDYNEEIEEVL